MATKAVRFYVQLVPEWYEGSLEGELQLHSVRAARMTARQPRDPLPGAVVVPILLHVDEMAFAPQDSVVAVVKTEGGLVELVGGEGNL